MHRTLDNILSILIIFCTYKEILKYFWKPKASGKHILKIKLQNYVNYFRSFNKSLNNLHSELFFGEHFRVCVSAVSAQTKKKQFLVEQTAVSVNYSFQPFFQFIP